MIIVGMHEAKTNFSKLVKQAEAGEEVIVSRGGEPVARIVAYSVPKKPRTPGSMKGKIWIAPDFDELPPEIAEAFGVD
ncbi:MAG: type II toxin-antitoxin system prevent-host-death family antitoxin [Gaiellaceae bacterium MAG52_C11]|nr:type II toxin-antitoxin system prevent-host-death family antitoxin [Candidatus Gaiellasilicea maunaloa]